MEREKTLNKKDTWTGKSVEKREKTTDEVVGREPARIGGKGAYAFD